MANRPCAQCLTDAHETWECPVLGDAIARQNKEFAALGKLVERFRQHNMTAVVDDDYPEVRHNYESAMQDFILALKGNNRLDEFPGKPAMRTYADAAHEALRELAKAVGRWPSFNSLHEGFAVLAEEVDELWEHVRLNQKKREPAAIRLEAIQVAAMALRIAVECTPEDVVRK